LLWCRGELGGSLTCGACGRMKETAKPSRAASERPQSADCIQRWATKCIRRSLSRMHQSCIQLSAAPLNPELSARSPNAAGRASTQNSFFFSFGVSLNERSGRRLSRLRPPRTKFRQSASLALCSCGGWAGVTPDHTWHCNWCCCIWKASLCEENKSFC